MVTGVADRSKMRTAHCQSSATPNILEIIHSIKL